MYTSIRLTSISLALKRSRRKATIAAQPMPPITPAIINSGVHTQGEALMPLVVAHKATPPAVIAPSKNWPSAPMFHTFER